MSEKFFEDKFNKVLQWIINFIGSISPSSFFGEYGIALNGFIAMSPGEPIAYFIEYIYKNDEYRTKLKNMDDAYFINQNIENVASNNIIGATIHIYIKKLFYFKELWISLDSMSKTMIKKAMRGLIIICKKYIDALFDAKFEKYDIKKQCHTNECCKSIQGLTDDYISKYDTDSISLSSSSINKKNKKNKQNEQNKSLKYVYRKMQNTHNTYNKNIYDAGSISIESSNEKKKTHNKNIYDAGSISIESSNDKKKKKNRSISIDL
jgi:hypothetical protein